jgi:ABC-type phosphate transport system substrate-binding protein
VKHSTRLATALAATGILALVGAGVAVADPSGAPAFRDLAGVGSDTTQDVMNGMADAVTISGTKVIGSYNAVGSATISTKATAACTNIARPNGSGAGRTALLNSLNANAGAGDGCFQFSRSSSLTLTASTPSLTYVPFATDAVTYVVTKSSVLPRLLNKADLQAIYHCDPSFVGASAPYAVTPILPQAGSGTRSYWEGQMGILDADVNAGTYPCIKNGTAGGQLIEEHSDSGLDDKSIAPFSIAQYTVQSLGVVNDKRGKAVMGAIGTGAVQAAVTGVTYPALMNPAFNVKRDVYNVIPTSKIADPTYVSVFGSTASSSTGICSQADVLAAYGFAPNANCGNTSQHS